MMRKTHLWRTVFVALSLAIGLSPAFPALQAAASSGGGGATPVYDSGTLCFDSNYNPATKLSDHVKTIVTKAGHYSGGQSTCGAAGNYYVDSYNSGGPYGYLVLETPSLPHAGQYTFDFMYSIGSLHDSLTEDFSVTCGGATTVFLDAVPGDDEQLRPLSVQCDFAAGKNDVTFTSMNTGSVHFDTFQITSVAQVQSDAPVVGSPIYDTDTSVSGTSTEAAGTDIDVFVNGAAAGSTTVDGSGNWILALGTALVAGELVHATATAAGETESVDSNVVTVLAAPQPVCTPQQWAKYGGNPVLDIGAPGAWDDEHVGIADVMKDYSDYKYKMWYAGDGANGRDIGYAYSYNRVDWNKDASNPVLETGAAGAWDSVQVAGPAVIKDGSGFKMWYMGFDGSHRRIGYATSPDEINWTKHGSNPVLDVGPSGAWDASDVAGPSVVFDGTTYHMWYAGAELNGFTRTYRVGYATSPDGISWTKHAGNPVLDVGASGEWDEKTLHPVDVVFDGTQFHMWYPGYDGTKWRTGYAASLDGYTWTKCFSDYVLDVDDGEWDGMRAFHPSVILKGSTFHMWYTGFDGTTARVGYANTGGGPVQTDTPVVDSPLYDGDTVVTGTSTEAAGTNIYIYTNGIQVASATVDGSGNWTSAVPTLFLNDLVHATAKATGEGMSADSNVVTVQSVIPIQSDAPVVGDPIYEGDTAVSGTSTEADGTTITLYVNGTAAGTGTVLANAWTLTPSVGLFLNDLVHATATASGETESSISNVVTVLAAPQVQSDAPVVDSPITAGDSTVSGTSTEADGTTITLYVNGTAAGTGTVSTNAWIIAPAVTLVMNDLVHATATASGETESAISNVVTVQGGGQPVAVDPPVVSSPVYEGDTSVSGTTTEADGTLIDVYVNGLIDGTTLAASGAWQLSPMTATLVAGDLIHAIARPDTNGDGSIDALDDVSLSSNVVTVQAAIIGQTATPTINEPLVHGETLVAGTSTEAAGTLIEVFINGAGAGSTTVTASGTWTLSPVPVLLEGQSVTAIATADTDNDGDIDANDLPSNVAGPVIVQGGGGRVYIEPTNTSIAIVPADDCTPTKEIMLLLKAKKASEVVVSNDPNFIGASWQSFPESMSSTEEMSISWLLTEGDENKTVYAMFRSSTGEKSRVVSTNIELDEATQCGTEVLGEEIEIPEDECDISCDRISYLIYIVNPDGTMRFMDTHYTQTDTLAEDIHRIRFEDSGLIDQDFNDVWVLVNKRDCSDIIFTLESVEASWQHKIGVYMMVDNVTKQDVILWENSHKADEGTVLHMNALANEAMCSEENLMTKEIRSGVTLYEGEYYTGKFQSLHNDVENFSEVLPDFDDNVASVKTFGFAKAFLFEHPFFEGIKETVSSSDSSLLDNLLGTKAASSIMVLLGQ